jgi:hypothetical protein
MWKTGGQKKKIADKVFAVLGRLNLGMLAFKDLQVTDHGERRIKGDHPHGRHSTAHLSEQWSLRRVKFSHSHASANPAPAH